MSVNPPDGPPVFTTPVVTVQVKEGKPPNTKITQVKAATVRTAQYTIVSGNTDDMFKIEPETGKILSRKTLDYEESPEYSLVIKAKDNEGNFSLHIRQTLDAARYERSYRTVPENHTQAKNSPNGCLEKRSMTLD